MKVKLNQKIFKVDGITPLPNNDKADTDLTLRDVCINSLLTPEQDDDKKKKYEKYDMYKKLRDAKTEVDLTNDDVAFIAELNAKIQPPLLLGQCRDYFEAASSNAKN